MKTYIGRFVAILVLITVMACFTPLVRDAEAWRGGYGGGSFRGGEYAEGPRGSMAVEGSQGGEAVGGPGGREAVEGPRGGAAVEGPNGNYAVRESQGKVAVGDRVTTLPAGSNRVIVSGQTYYVAGGIYYMPYYYGGDITYVVVENPNND
jgi:Family of unknown function (DUF6515)